jgi:hypothetical protein
LVETADHGHPDADVLTIVVSREVDRIDRRVDGVAEQVPHARGPDQREKEIGSRADAIAAQRIAERAEMMRHADTRRRVQQPADAERGVDHEAGRRLCGARRPHLEHVVDHHYRLGKIDQEVVDALADLARGQGVIERRQGPDHKPVEGVLQGESGAVERLERIVDAPAAPWRGVAGSRDQQQADGDDPCAQGGSWFARRGS